MTKNQGICPDGLGVCDRGCEVNCKKAMERDGLMAPPTSKPKLEDFPHPQGGYSTMSFHNALIYWQECEIERLRARLNPVCACVDHSPPCPLAPSPVETSPVIADPPRWPMPPPPKTWMPAWLREFHCKCEPNGDAAGQCVACQAADLIASSAEEPSVRELTDAENDAMDRDIMNAIKRDAEKAQEPEAPKCTQAMLDEADRLATAEQPIFDSIPIGIPEKASEPFERHPDYCMAHGGHLVDSPACKLAREREKRAEKSDDRDPTPEHLLRQGYRSGKVGDK